MFQNHPRGKWKMENGKRTYIDEIHRLFNLWNLLSSKGNHVAFSSGHRYGQFLLPNSRLDFGK